MVGPFWVLLVLMVGSSVLFGTSARASHHHGNIERERSRSCPRGWKEKPFLCYEESRNEFDFESSLIYCLNQQELDTEWNGQFYGLISVGQLRHFKNRYQYADTVDRHHHNQFDDHQRLFRVNARKDYQGIWREFFTGKEVQFHHYPGFNPKAAKRGDTLVWDSRLNKLYTADPGERHHALCSAPKSDTCKQCPDAQWHNECNNAGDCLDGICYCDIGFEGKKCQIEPLEDSHMDLIVYAGNVSSGEKYSFVKNSSCFFNGFPVNIENPVFGEFGGHPIACGGNQIEGVSINQCWKYQHDKWLPEPDMQVTRSGAAATVINDGRHDLIYWVTFGEDELGNDLSSSEYLPWYGEHWRSGPALDAEYARKGHCAVQINPCEAAILGGVSNDTNYRDDILIFNFEDAKWKQGPSLSSDRANLACAVIRDSQSDHPLVISACGLGPLGQAENVVEKWDLTTWDIQVLPHTCPAGVDYFDSAWPISDREIIFTTGSGSEAASGIWSFTLDYGFRKVDNWANERTGAGSALTSKSNVDCFE